jgi:L-lactate dehydrogenase complex protein LldF
VSDHGTPGGYRRQAAALLRDEPHVREAVLSGTDRVNMHRNYAYAQIDSDRWRDWGRDVKTHALTHLDHYLEEAERNLQANGVHVHWAETAAEARTVLRGIVREHDVRSVVKAKSMLTEELDVNEHLERLNVHVRETDLGEYIVQILGQAPSHIVAPVMHLSLDDCRRLFHEHLGTPLDCDPEELVAAARATLRKEFLAADLGISGANFLVAETGTVALIENEGNIRLSTSLPRVHVAFVGIEKVIPRFEDLAGFVQLTARAATGQPIGNYVSFIQGPRKNPEVDGPVEMHVVFVDNGRTRLLADEKAWEALRCVRCGACLNVCPVYRQTGGQVYGFAYSGPIGAIISPGILGLEKAMPLPFASSLCGACADVCPVRIPIPELLVHWREKAVEAGLTPLTERAGLGMFKAAAQHPLLFRAGGSLLRHTPWQSGGKSLPILGGWMQSRDAPKPSPKSFTKLWKEGIE